MGRSNEQGPSEPQSEPVLESKAGPARYVILDRKNNRPYLPRLWTKQEAEVELWYLLRPYPEGHEWRLRLVVQEWDKPIRRDWNY